MAINETIASIQFKQGKSEDWKNKNLILKSGEPGFETDTQKFKIGNGSDPWNDLKCYVTEDEIGITQGEKEYSLQQISDSPCSAKGRYSIALGQGSETTGRAALAAGENSKANGLSSIAIGTFAKTYGTQSQAFGSETKAWARQGHAEGYQTVAGSEEEYKKEESSHVIACHAEGSETIASGTKSHAEGSRSQAIGEVSHAEGADTVAKGKYSHAEGWKTKAQNEGCHAEGVETFSGGLQEIKKTNSIYTIYFDPGLDVYNYYPKGSIAEYVGFEDTSGDKPRELYYAISEADYSENITYDMWIPIIEISDKWYIEGGESRGAHAEGFSSLAGGEASHAEGYKTIASGIYSHAEGDRARADGAGAHAEGCSTIAHYRSHAEGESTEAGVIGVVSKRGAHAEGIGTKALDVAMHAQGLYNATTSGLAHVIGWGTKTTPKDIHTIDTLGNAWFSGSVAANSIFLKDQNNPDNTYELCVIDGKLTLKGGDE